MKHRIATEQISPAAMRNQQVDHIARVPRSLQYVDSARAETELIAITKSSINRAGLERNAGGIAVCSFRAPKLITSSSPASRARPWARKRPLSDEDDLSAGALHRNGPDARASAPALRHCPAGFRRFSNSQSIDRFGRRSLNPPAQIRRRNRWHTHCSRCRGVIEQPREPLATRYVRAEIFNRAARWNS